MARQPICGRCGAVGPFGFGPPHGQTGPTVWACEDHRDAAEAWRAERYDRKPLIAEDQRHEVAPRAAQGTAQGTAQGQPDLFGEG